MSRFDFDGNDDWSLQLQNLWDENVRRSINGKRGQRILRELEEALLAMPYKTLVSGAIAYEGSVCAIGALALHKKLKAGLDEETAIAELETESQNVEDADGSSVWAKDHLGMTYSLAWSIAHVNDEGLAYGAKEQQRYEIVLAWVRSHIKREAVPTS